MTRLRDMGVEPFLLSSSLIGVLAQRLVRKLCPHCKHVYSATLADCEVLGVDPATPPTLYAPTGCERCNQSGYRGRTGIFELVVVDEAMQTLIHEGHGEQELERHARLSSSSIRDDGRRRVLAGDTALAELVRVTRED
jgi:general secretion pathway protein E